MLVLTHNGTAVEGIKVTGGSALTVKLNAEATEPGNYALTIAAGASVASARHTIIGSTTRKRFLWHGI